MSRLAALFDARANRRIHDRRGSIRFGLVRRARFHFAGTRRSQVRIVRSFEGLLQGDEIVLLLPLGIEEFDVGSQPGGVDLAGWDRQQAGTQEEGCGSDFHDVYCPGESPKHTANRDRTG